MKFLAFNGLGLNTNLLTTFYKVAIRSILEYGSITFMHTPSALKFMQQKQNQAARIIGKFPTYVNQVMLELDLNLTPIKERFEYLSIAFLQSIPKRGTPPQEATHANHTAQPRGLHIQNVAIPHCRPD